MEYNFLPGTQIKVSKICLGTMTWGRQNSEEEGHAQMDYAYEQGVNFFDTAELYPIPPRQEEQGDTERFIGTWFKKSKRRDQIILASKIAGPAAFTKHIRTDVTYSKKSIDTAVENSLKRLQTDYIDLYQLHWPERPTNYFGKRGYDFKRGDLWKENFQEVLDALQGHVVKGNIRYIGLSNETPWGTMGFLNASSSARPRVRTIQNPYSLLNRIYEVGLAEISQHESIGLLAYSPLGFGQLTGKYINKTEKNSRLGLFGDWFTRYSNQECLRAVEKYLKIADKYNLSLTHLALAFVNTRPFVTSNIIGATTMEQLRENIDSVDIEITETMLEDINQVHSSQPNPAP